MSILENNTLLKIFLRKFLRVRRSCHGARQKKRGIIRAFSYSFPFIRFSKDFSAHPCILYTLLTEL